MRRISFIIVAGFAITLASCTSETAEDVADRPFSEGLAAYSEGEFGKALTILEPHAEGGDSAAQMMLAEIYLTGKTGVTDEKRGATWLEKAADQGVTKAQAMMGTRYLNGNGVEQDDTRGIEYLLAAAKGGNARANVQLGFLYEHGKAVEKSADAAGRFYYRASIIGDGEAVTRLKKLSETDVIGPKTYLGLLYRDGKGVPQDPNKAFSLVEHDAQSGQPYAQYLISEAYGVGQGTERDVETAYMWANLSAAQSFAGAMERRDIWAQIMTPEQIEKAQDLSRDWQAKFDAKTP